jgi:hypothetical protein
MSITTEISPSLIVCQENDNVWIGSDCKALYRAQNCEPDQAKMFEARAFEERARETKIHESYSN